MTTKYTITIRDGGGDTPLLLHQNQMSETEHRRKGQLYNKAQRDRNPQKKQKPINSNNKLSRDDKGLRQTGVRSSGEDQQSRRAQKKLMQDLDKMSKNQASLQMVHNSNNILKRQNQILEENQKTIHQMARNNGKKQNQGITSIDRTQYDYMLGQIKREVGEMKKIKEQIERSSKQFMKTMSEAGRGNVQPSVPGDLNSNLKNLAQISKNQLQGLQNLQAIKNLQNFNIQGYQQSINNLKKQIVQYQKQSQQIQRQLKIRAAKLQKLDFNPKFDEQILQPYQNYLKKKADSIDIFAKRQQVYQRLGHFDYGKFEYDMSQIMADVKNQINQFHITCKQFRIQVPDVKIDQRQLKGLQLKLPSAIDQFKAERGIDFNKPKVAEKGRTQTLSDSRNRRQKRKGEAVVSLKSGKQSKSHKHPQGVRQLNTKPVDMTTQIRYNKANQPNQKTVLQNQRQRQQKIVQGNIKKMRKPKQDEDFQKYLQFRAKQQLQLIYKERKQRLQKKQQQLYNYCKEEPEVYLNLDLRNQVKREVSRQKKQQQRSPIKKEEEKIQQPQQESEDLPKLKPIPGTGGQTVKEVGTQVLKQKLNNLFRNNIPRRPNIQPQVYQQQVQPQQIHPQGVNLSDGGLAENIVGVLNNALTQVNTQLSKTIQSKYEHRSLSKEKNQSYRKSPPKIQIPKLEQFNPPPAFNMPVYNPIDHQNHQPYYPPPPQMPASLPVTIPQKPKPEPKILPKNYQHLRIKEEQAIGDLQISQDSYQPDFE